MSNREFAKLLGLCRMAVNRLIEQGTNPSDRYRAVLEQRGLSDIEIARWKIFFAEKINAKFPQKTAKQTETKKREKRIRSIPVKPELNLSLTDEQITQINQMSLQKRTRINFIFSLLQKAQKLSILDATQSNKELNKLLRIENEKARNQISARRFQEIVLKIRNLGLQKFIDDWDKSGKGMAGKTIVNETDFAVYISHFVRDNYLASNQAYQITLGEAIRTGRFNPENEKFPCEKTFFNQAQKMVGNEAINLIRKGEDYWKRNHAPYITRDISNLRPMQVLVGDCMTCDTDVRIRNAKIAQIGHSFERGKRQPDWIRVRPFLTAWIDFKTGRFVGYEFHIEDENTGHILTTLRHAISRFGKPEMIYVDNGKTFANKELERILPTLNIEKKHAIKYNAQAKFIERCFGIFHSQFERVLPGYVGVNKLRTPKSTDKARKDLEKNENIEYLMTFEEYVEKATKFIEEIYLKSVFEDGMRAENSPLSIWNAEYDETTMTKPSDSALSLMLSRWSNPFTVVRHQIKDLRNEISYNAEKLPNGTKVYLRRDSKDLTTAYAYGEQDNFICKLSANPKIAAIYQNEEEIAEFEIAMKQKRIHEKTFVREKMKVVKEIQKEHSQSGEKILENREFYNDYRATQLGINNETKDVKLSETITQNDRDLLEAKRQEEFGKIEIPFVEKPQPKEWLWDFEEGEDLLVS